MHMNIHEEFDTVDWTAKMIRMAEADTETKIEQEEEETFKTTLWVERMLKLAMAE